MSCDMRLIIQRIEDEAQKEMEENVRERLLNLLDQHMTIKDLDSCKHLINRLRAKGLLKDALNSIYYNDNLELFIHAHVDDVPEKFNSVLTDTIFSDVLYRYDMATRINRRYRDGKIINFFLEKYPELCTYEVIDTVIRLGNIPLVQRLRKITPNFYPKLGRTFNKLYNKCLSRHHDRRDIKMMLDYLIKEGFRPEYYSFRFDATNPRSFTFKGFFINWNKLPFGNISITHIDTQSKITIRRLGTFDTEGTEGTEGTEFGDDELRIEVDREMELDDPCFNFLKTYYERIFTIRTLVNDRGITLLNDPIFAPLKEPPSFFCIIKNIIGIHGVKLDKLPSRLLE